MRAGDADFKKACEASAKRYGARELDLHDAVDDLQEQAVKCGFVRMIAQDAVQSVMAAAFRPYREGQQS